MICQDVVAKTTDYLERALSEDERRAWDEHTAKCLDCARYAAQLCLTVRLISTTRWARERDIPDSL